MSIFFAVFVTTISETPTCHDKDFARQPAWKCEAHLLKREVVLGDLQGGVGTDTAQVGQSRSPGCSLNDRHISLP